MAGKYNSFKIQEPKIKNLEKNIDLIIKDFKNKKDQIIIQNFIDKMDFSGVIFTKDPRTGSDYFVVNYDVSGETNLVTSGSKNLSMKTLYVYKNKYSSSNKFKKIFDKIKVIEKIFNNDCLDIEFGIKKKKLYIFQCRPLINRKKNIKRKIIQLNKRKIKI